MFTLTLCHLSRSGAGYKERLSFFLSWQGGGEKTPHLRHFTQKIHNVSAQKRNTIIKFPCYAVHRGQKCKHTHRQAHFLPDD